MKRNIYIIAISIITVVCIIIGICINVTGTFGGSLAKLILKKSYTTEVSSGNFQTLDKFDEIDADTDLINIAIVAGDSYGYTLNSNQKLSPSIEITDGKLKITQNGHHSFFGVSSSSRCDLTITVPADAVIKKAEISADVGNIEISDVKLNNCSIEADVGSVKVSGISFGKLEIEADIGDVTLSGINGIEDCNVSIKTDVGSVEFLGENVGTGYTITAASNTAPQLKVTADVGSVKISK